MICHHYGIVNLWKKEEAQVTIPALTEIKMFLELQYIKAFISGAALRFTGAWDIYTKSEIILAIMQHFGEKWKVKSEKCTVKGEKWKVNDGK